MVRCFSAFKCAFLKTTFLSVFKLISYLFFKFDLTRFKTNVESLYVLYKRDYEAKIGAFPTRESLEQAEYSRKNRHCFRPTVLSSLGSGRPSNSSRLFV